MTVKELRALLAPYRDDKEVVILRRLRRRLWAAGEISSVMNGDDSYLFESAEDFKGKVVLE